MSAIIGQPASRVDGRAKVTGMAEYAAEFTPPRLLHAALVTSTAPRGLIADIDTAAAEDVEGVRAVITHLNALHLPYRPFAERPPVDPESGEQLRVFQGPEVFFNGQPIGVVVAETLEQARHAAALVRVSYACVPPATRFDARRGRAPSEGTSVAGESHRGDADRALADTLVKVDARYVHPREYHNAMEMHATIAVWRDERLTLYDKTQWVDNDREEIAHVFGISDKRVRVISPFVGGAFGSGQRTWPHVTVAALAARTVGRPVRLELTRRELYTSVGFRPHTEQRVALGAQRDGTLTAIIHEATAQTSVYEEYTEDTLDPARMTYACPNVRTRYRLVEMDVSTPCPMRSPGIVSGCLALEMAMDELAVALDMDPVELRLRNHADHNEHNGLPWSSKELRACYRAAAERFGWTRRSWHPRSMREGRTLIGQGMATAVYPAYRDAASASATMLPGATVLVRTAASDMGPGTYTSLAQVAAETLGVPLGNVTVELGDTELPKAPVHSGSMTMASVGSAVQAACEALSAKVLARASRRAARAGVSWEAIFRDNGIDRVDANASVRPGAEAERWSSYAFGAVFAEVRIDADLGTVRVCRLVGAYDAGRIVSPKLARSQGIGGMVGGIGMALLETTDWDERFGRVMNGNFAEYLVPVSADVSDLEVIFVSSDDRRFNSLGVKGLAEVTLCGVAPAIANAVYAATGKRIRELPITADKVLA